MAKKLTELFPVQTAVEILHQEWGWVPGTVVYHQHPAVWVRTADGHHWFVTNRQRIRLFDQPEQNKNA